MCGGVARVFLYRIKGLRSFKTGLIHWLNMTFFPFCSGSHCAGDWAYSLKRGQCFAALPLALCVLSIVWWRRGLTELPRLDLNCSEALSFGLQLQQVAGLSAGCELSVSHSSKSQCLWIWVVIWKETIDNLRFCEHWRHVPLACSVTRINSLNL